MTALITPASLMSSSSVPSGAAPRFASLAMSMFNTTPLLLKPAPAEMGPSWKSTNVRWSVPTMSLPDALVHT